MVATKRTPTIIIDQPMTLLFFCIAFGVKKTLSVPRTIITIAEKYFDKPKTAKIETSRSVKRIPAKIMNVSGTGCRQLIFRVICVTRDGSRLLSRVVAISFMFS